MSILKGKLSNKFLLVYTQLYSGMERLQWCDWLLLTNTSTALYTCKWNMPLAFGNQKFPLSSNFPWAAPYA